MKKFYPEGIIINSEHNKALIQDIDGFKKALEQDIILEAFVKLCDNSLNLVLDIPFANVYIPKNEAAIGVVDGHTKDIAIISRVGKPVCFKVLEISDDEFPTIIVSRVLAQKDATMNYISTLSSGDIIPAIVTHLEPFGAFVDVGCGIVSLIGIENISVSRINHPSDRFFINQSIFCVVTENLSNRISLSHKELLGTWRENVDLVSANSTVIGVVRSIEPYGIFIELTPNLSGLAEYKDGFAVSDFVSVHIKSISEEKMKIKLNIINKLDKLQCSFNYKYFISSKKIKHFRYSPENCTKKNIFREF